MEHFGPSFSEIPSVTQNWKQNLKIPTETKSTQNIHTFFFLFIANLIPLSFLLIIIGYAAFRAYLSTHVRDTILTKLPGIS